jgi:hypothetical protein
MVKWPVDEVEQPLPSAVKVKKVWSYTTTLPCDSMAWYFVTNRDFFLNIT